jgi:hypothetical protein
MKILAVLALAAVPFLMFSTPSAQADSNSSAVSADATAQAVAADDAALPNELNFMSQDFRPPGHGWPGHGWPGHGGGRGWECTARDLFRTGYKYIDYDVRSAQWGALEQCRRESAVGRCYLLRCNRI